MFYNCNNVKYIVSSIKVSIIKFLIYKNNKII